MVPVSRRSSRWPPSSELALKEVPVAAVSRASSTSPQPESRLCSMAQRSQASGLHSISFRTCTAAERHGLHGLYVGSWSGRSERSEDACSLAVLKRLGYEASALLMH